MGNFTFFNTASSKSSMHLGLTSHGSVQSNRTSGARSCACLMAVTLNVQHLSFASISQNVHLRVLVLLHNKYLERKDKYSVFQSMKSKKRLILFLLPLSSQFPMVKIFITPQTCTKNK